VKADDAKHQYHNHHGHQTPSTVPSSPSKVRPFSPGPAFADIELDDDFNKVDKVRSLLKRSSPVLNVDDVGWRRNDHKGGMESLDRGKATPYSFS
jgi:hypothetical protein